MVEDDGTRSRGTLRPYGRRRRFRVEADKTPQVKGETIKRATGMFGEEALQYTSDAYILERAIEERVRVPWIVTRKKEREEEAKRKREEEGLVEKEMQEEEGGGEVEEVPPTPPPKSSGKGGGRKKKKTSSKNNQSDEGGWL